VSVAGRLSWKFSATAKPARDLHAKKLDQSFTVVIKQLVKKKSVFEKHALTIT
jgi:hypothetical protein